MVKHLILISISVVIGACSGGGGGGGGTPATYQYSMSGAYNFPNVTASSPKGSTVGIKAVTGNFTLKWNEAAQAITGTYTDSNNLTGTVTGTIQGTTREIIVTFSSVVAGAVKSFLFSLDQAAISNGNLTNSTVVARNASGGVVDNGTYSASIEVPDDGHGGGASITCTGNPSGDMASWGFMKGCRLYKVIHSMSNYQCPYSINMPVNIGVNGDGTVKILVNDDIIFDGGLMGAQSSVSAGTFGDPNPPTPDSKRLTLSFNAGVPTTGAIQVIENTNTVTAACMLEYVEDL